MLRSRAIRLVPHMSSPDSVPTPPASAAARYAAVFVTGLVVGLFALLVLLRALESRRTWDAHYPSAVMHLYQAQLAQLRAAHASGDCAAPDTRRRLETMRAVSNDLEPAFPALRDHRRFVGEADRMRSALDLALGAPLDSCAALETSLREVERACSDCHRDFRN